MLPLDGRTAPAAILARRGGLRTIGLPSQHVRQLRDVGGDAPGLVASDEVRCRATVLAPLEIDVGECLPIGVAHAARTGGTPMFTAVEEM